MPESILPPVSPFRASLDRALSTLPAFKRAAEITVRVEGKTVRVLAAARLNDQWQIAGALEKEPDLPVSAEVRVTWAG